MDDLEAIRAKIKNVQAELERLENAERVIVEIRSVSRGSALIPLAMTSPPGRATNFPKKFESLTAAVKGALGLIGPATTSQIVQWIKENYNAEANPHSIRSMLSIWGGKNLITHEGDKWGALPKEKSV